MFKVISYLYNCFTRPQSPDLLDPLLTEAFVHAGRENITRIACVCKRWRDLTETDSFYKQMWEKHQVDFFGENLFGDPGERPAIPASVLRLFCRIPSNLIWKPETVSRPGEAEPRSFCIDNITKCALDPLIEYNLEPGLGVRMKKWDHEEDFYHEDRKGEWVLICKPGVRPESLVELDDSEEKNYRIHKGEPHRTSDIALLFLSQYVRDGITRFSRECMVSRILRFNPEGSGVNWFLDKYGRDITNFKSYMGINYVFWSFRDPETNARYGKMFTIAMWKENDEPSFLESFSIRAVSFN